MKSLNFIIGILVVFGLFSCNSNTNNLIGEDSSKNSLDWAGSYWGIIPCENCPGIEMELKINSDETFIFTKNYLEKENSETIIEGKFTWINNGNSIELSGFSENEKAPIFKIEENQIRYLNQKGEEIKGELADNYILRKNGNPLVDNKKWKIVEIYGQKVEGGEDEFFMNFNAEDSKVYAKIDCNLMNWDYKIRNELQIEFSNGLSSLMFCPDSLEDQFIEAINQADNISTDGKTLSINKARMAPMVVLEIWEF